MGDKALDRLECWSNSIGCNLLFGQVILQFRKNRLLEPEERKKLRMPKKYCRLVTCLCFAVESQFQDYVCDSHCFRATFRYHLVPLQKSQNVTRTWKKSFLSIFWLNNNPRHSYSTHDYMVFIKVEPVAHNCEREGDEPRDVYLRSPASSCCTSFLLVSRLISQARILPGS